MAGGISTGGEVTQLLRSWREGDSAAFDALVPIVYRELRNIAAWQMRGEGSGHTLSPTALLHESFLKLVKGQSDQEFQDRRHFFLVAARAMRQLLIDHARRKRASKRVVDPSDASGPPSEGPTGSNVLDVHRALERLEALDPRRARFVELRHFGGMSVREIGETMDVSAATVSRELRTAEAWLAHTIKGGT